MRHDLRTRKELRPDLDAIKNANASISEVAETKIKLSKNPSLDELIKKEERKRFVSFFTKNTNYADAVNLYRNLKKMGYTDVQSIVKGIYVTKEISSEFLRYIFENAGSDLTDLLREAGEIYYEARTRKAS